MALINMSSSSRTTKLYDYRNAALKKTMVARFVPIRVKRLFAKFGPVERFFGSVLFAGSLPLFYIQYKRWRLGPENFKKFSAEFWINFDEAVYYGVFKVPYIGNFSLFDPLEVEILRKRRQKKLDLIKAAVENDD